MLLDCNIDFFGYNSGCNHYEDVGLTCERMLMPSIYCVIDYTYIFSIVL